MPIDRPPSDAQNLQLAFGFHQKGQLNQAERLYKDLIRRQPAHFDAIYLLGMLHAQQGKLETAAKFFGKAARIKPDFVDAHYNHGVMLNALALHGAAISSYDNVLRLKPDHIDALRNRATSLFELRRLQEALDGYDRVLKIKGDYAEAFDNRGVVLRELTRFEEALESHDRALKIAPNNAEFLTNRGVALRALMRFEEALQSYDRAIQIKPEFADAHNNRGATLIEMKRFIEALQSFDRAIQLKSDYAEAYSGRGAALGQLKHIEDALLSHERAIQLKPDFEFLAGHVLFGKMKICDWKNYRSNVAKLCDGVSRGKKVTDPFSMLVLSSSRELQLKASESWVSVKCPSSGALGDISKRSIHQRIRVGYFSADFHQHVTAVLTTELFEWHDRSKFEVIAFSFGPDTGDDARERLKGVFEKFIDVQNMSDRDIALVARSLEIDIAVDLKGFTEDARTNIFAMRAAPIQVNYLGFPGTMGAGFIDYLIADRTVIPASSRLHYAEKIVYMPDSYQPNDRNRQISDRAFARSELGLPQEGFVFCCFNNTYKSSPNVFESWMRILAHVEGSVLWLLEDNEIAARNLKKEAGVRGIFPERLVFAPRMALPDHLARHRMADLFLDTMPYNAHTTASDALWAGLPVLTQMGETFAGRVAASLLNAMHLPELIASTKEAYETLAIEFAANPAKLASIKQKIAENRLTTPLFDIELFTKHIETAYTMMYERYHADLPPDHIYVPQ